MFMQKLKLPTTYLNLILSLIISIGLNLSFWSKLNQAYPVTGNVVFYLSQLTLNLSVNYTLLTLISYRLIYIPLITLILTIATITAYGMDAFGYIFDSNFIQNSLETDLKEIYDLISVKLITYIVLFIIIPTTIIKFKVKIEYPSIFKNIKHILLGCVIFIFCIGSMYKNYSSYSRNHKYVKYYMNPSRIIFVASTFILEKVNNPKYKEFVNIFDTTELSKHIPASQKPTLVVLVVGESARSDRFSLNSYSRETNPLLSKIENLHSFKQVYSCGTETSVSLPCMFSHLPREKFNLAAANNTENLLDLLSKAQIDVLWRDNDSGCKNICNRVPTDDFNYQKLEPYYNGFECYDEVLLDNFKKIISNIKKDTLIILHPKGSHGPAYSKRYPASMNKFTPQCTNNELTKCTNEEIGNAYDNTILYTDYLLHKTIEQLKVFNNLNIAMLYISDHGESLGEKGIYLHAMPYLIAPIEQIHVPMLFWQNNEFIMQNEQLIAQLNNKYSHDNLFHTVVGIFKIKTDFYNKDLDIFNPKH